MVLPQICSCRYLLPFWASKTRSRQEKLVCPHGFAQDRELKLRSPFLIGRRVPLQAGVTALFQARNTGLCRYLQVRRLGNGVGSHVKARRSLFFWRRLYKSNVVSVSAVCYAVLVTLCTGQNMTVILNYVLIILFVYSPIHPNSLNIF